MSFSICFDKNVENPQTCTQVKAVVDTGLSVEKPVLAFTWECGNQYSAELLKRHLTKSLGNFLESIRRKAYETGWKDARSKKRKKTGFFTGFYNDGVGW